MLNTTSKAPAAAKATAAGTATGTGRRTLAKLLLSSSAASALAVALAATVSTTIATPANAQACVIDHTANPWSVTCYTGNTTALNPDTANGASGWGTTNDYTSANLGIVVTVQPGASVTPAGTAWYFGNSGTPDIDDGGPFLFTMGNATASATLNGDIMVGGNIQLTSNSANFTNFGNVTGSVGLGTGNLPQSRMGGPVTFYNGRTGTIGGCVTVYSGTTGAGPSGTQNFNNVGVIGGGVLLDTAGSEVVNNPGPSFNFTGNIVAGGNGTTFEISAGTSTSADTYSLTHNGGFISATNSGFIGGPVSISANDGAYQNNSGNIAGPVNVIDSVDNTLSSSTSMSVATFEQSFATATATSTNGQTVTTTYSALTGPGGPFASSETVNWSATVNSSIWSAGNMATLINSGTIGSSVFVNGDMGASATNLGSGTIFGDVTVTSINRIGNSSSTWQGNDLIGSSFPPVVISASSSDVVVFSPAAANATSSFTQSTFAAFGETSAHSWTFTNVSTTNYLGGNASLANNGNITGGVTVTGVDSAALNSTGFIGDPTVVANSFNISSTSGEMRASTSAEGTQTSYSVASTPSGNVQSFSFASNFATSSGSAENANTVSMAVGGTATLVNTGNIGAGATITGQALASLSNSGTINGFVTVSADNYTYGTGYSFSSAHASQSSDTIVTLVNTGGNSTMGAPGTTFSVVTSFNVTGSNSSFDAESSSYVVAAGTAIVSNTGNITGPITVEASGNATLVNTGHILDPLVVANWNNSTSVESSLEVRTSNTLSTSSYSLNTLAAGNYIQSFVTSVISVSGSSDSLSGTSTESTTHGVAALTNSGNATIGNATTLVPVTVIGQQSALLNNSGIIFADGVLVSAVEFTGSASVTEAGLFSRTNTAISFEYFNTGGNTTSGAAGFLTLSGFSFGSVESGSFSANSSEASFTTGGNATLINSGNLTGTGTVSVVGGSSATLMNSGQMLDPYVIANSFNTFSSYTTYDVWTDSNIEVSNYTGAYDAANITGNGSNFLQTFSFNSTETYNTSYGSMTSQTTATSGGVALLTNAANSTIGAPNNYTPVIVTGQASAGLINSGTIYSGDIMVQALSYNKGCMSTFNVTFADNSAVNSFTIVNTGNNTTSGALGAVVSSGSMYSFASAETSTGASSSSITYTGGTANLTNTGVIDPVNGTLSVIGAGSATLTNSGNITESHINVQSDVSNTADMTATSATQLYASNENYNTAYAYTGNVTVTNENAFGNLSRASVSSETITATTTSAGGVALLNNSGFIVGGNSSTWTAPTVSVVGDTSATLINTGNIEPFAGNITNGGVFVDVRSISGNASSMIGCVSTHTFADAWTSNTNSVFVSGNATQNFFQSSVSTDAKSWLHSSAVSFSFTSAVYGGSAGVTNSGNIAGSVSVEGGASAALTNSGFIGESFGLIGVSAGEGSFAFGCVTSSLSAGNDTRLLTVTGNLSGNFTQTSSFALNDSGTTSSAFTFAGVETGGNASLVNSGVIGLGNKTTLQTTAPMDVLVEAFGTASANNSGTIFGCLTVSAVAQSGMFSVSHVSSEISSSADNTYSAVNISGNLGNVISSSWTSANTQGWSDSTTSSAFAVGNVTGGVASLTNTGAISGDVSVLGGTNASVVNTINGNLTGVIAGNVTVSAQAWDTLHQSVTMSSDQGNSSFTTGTTSVTDTQSTKFNYATSYAGTSSSTSLENISYTNSTISTATTASLQNDGTIGTKTAGVNVNVVADGTTASAINTGTIWGNLSVAAKGFVSADSFTQSYAASSAEVSSYYQNVMSGGNLVSGNLLVSAYPEYTPNTSTAFSWQVTSAESSTFMASYNVTGGQGNIVNSGKIVGSVYVSAPGGATLTNSGNITGVGNSTSISFGTVDVFSSGCNTLYVTQHSSLDAYSISSMDASSQVQKLDAGGNVTATVFNHISTEAENDSYTSVSSSTYTQVAAGSSAVLVNSATGKIGVPNPTTAVDINVSAEGATASFNNSGLVWANNVNVIATMPSLSNSSQETYGSTYTDTAAESSTYINNSVFLPGNATILPSYYASSTGTFAASGATSGTTQYTQSYTSLGGAASLVNNAGGIMIVENLTVAGDSSASFVNSGIIGPETAGPSHDYVIISDATNSLVTSAETFTSGFSGTTTSNESGTLNGTTLTVTNSGAGGGTSVSASNESYTASHYSSGGNASLVNNAGAIIGGYPVSIFVTADQTASVINAGEIDGNVTAMGYGFSATAVGSNHYSTSATTASSDMWTTITGNLIAANMSFSYFPTSVHMDSYSAASNGAFSYVSVSNVVSGVGTLTNASGASITGNVTVSGPYGASLVNSGTIGGGTTSGGVIAQEIRVLSIGANVSYTDTGNFTGMSARSDSYSAARVLGSDANLTRTFSDAGGHQTSYSSFEAQQLVTTQMGVGATLTNNSGGVIGSLVHPMTVVVDAVGPSTVINNGIINGDIYIGQDQDGSQPVNTSQTSVESTFSASSSGFNNSWSTINSNLTGTPVVTPTSFANITTTSFSQSQSFSSAEVRSTVSSTASYSGTGNVYGAINLATSGNVTFNNNGTIGSPFGGGSLEVVSSGTNFSFNSVETATRSGNTTDANISPNGSSGTHTFTGMSSSTTIENSTSATTLNGGAVSFNNSGTIGGNASNPIYVYVNGPAGATANNSGTIYGDLEVESDFQYYNNPQFGTSVESITFGGSQSTTIVTNYSGTKVTSQSSTMTNSPFFSASSSFSGVPLGGNTTVVNSGTITGELIASSAKNVLVINSGKIWQSVSLEAYGDSDSSVESTTNSGMSVDTSSHNSSATTSVHTGVTSATSFDSLNHVSSGGNATLINSGTIGLLTGQKTGSLALFTTDPTDGDAYPNVTLYADQNANVTNTGSILGNVYEYVVGGNETNVTQSNVVTSTTVTTITTTGVFAGAGSSMTTVTVFNSTTTYNSSFASVETGGTATLINSGNIGQSFASSIKSGGCLTATGGVYLHGMKGATIINSGLIGGDAEATAEAFNSSSSRFSVETLSGTQTVIAINTSLTNTATTRSSSVDIFHSTSTSISVPTGGSATITNTGSIGIDELNSQEQPVATGASVIADGQAGALITNSGVIQAQLVEANSFWSASSEIATDDGTLTYTFDSTIGNGTMTVGGTEVQTYSRTDLAGGGTATIINSGRMLSSNQINLESGLPIFGTLQVTADSYGNATVINQKGGLIEGDVTAESGGNTSIINSVTTTTFTPFGVGTQTTTYSASGNWSGGTALVDNSGNIGGFVHISPNFPAILVGGNVYSSGYTAGMVINRAGASILNNASANSAFQNYSITSNTVTTGGNPVSSTFTENVGWVGGVASLDNFGYIGGEADAGQFNFVTDFFDVASGNATGGVQFGNLTNEQGARVGGFVSANSLFIGVNNVNGNVTSPLYGGFANVTNKGIVGEGFYVTSLKGSTLFNAANAQINGDGGNDSFMLTVNGQNSFTNYGTIGSVGGGNIGGIGFGNALSLYVDSLLGIPSEDSTIEFSGNTTAVNYGIITSDLVFTNVAAGELNPNNVTANATFTFGQGSVLTGDINDQADLLNGETYGNLTINFSGVSGISGNATVPGGGIYQGNIWYATATNVTAPGRWILTGQNLYLGQTTINNPNPGPVAWLQIGTPLNYFLNNPGQLLDVILGQNLDPLQGLDPFYGNSAVSPALNSVLTPSLTSNLISAIRTNPIITGNISIGTNGGLEGQAVIIGGVSNSGYLLPGWALPNNTSSTLANLIANTNQILPGQFEISGNYTQTSTGTFVTNFAPTINRPAAKFVGTQAGPFAPVSFWLSVSPFQADTTPSSSIVVDGNASVAGTVQVYVNTGGLYVNGDSRTIVYDVGNLTLGNASVAQSAPSQFVHFGLKTGAGSVGTIAGNISYNTLNVVVQRTSYASAANSGNGQAVGAALDNAVTQVSNEITGANGFVFANMTQFNNAQDMAGFLSDLDWRSGNLTNAAAILNDVAPSGYAAALAIDTGAGFENQVNKHLLDNRGAGAQGDPLASAFIQAYGLNQRVNSTAAAQGIAGDTAGLAAGLDFQITDDFTLGTALGWSNTSLNGNHDFGGSMNAIQAGIYSTITMGQWYLDTTVWENFVHGNMDRAEPLIDRAFNASFRDDEFRADAEIGYRFNFTDTPIDNLGITPYIGFDYRGVDLGNFSESAAAVSSLEVPDGALGVNVKTLNHDILQPYFGVTADGVYRISPLVVMKPMIGIGVQFGTPANTILAQFEGGGSPFTVRGPQSNSAYLVPEAGLEFKIGPTYSLSFSYRAQLSGQYSQEGGWLTLRGSW